MSTSAALAHPALPPLAFIRSRRPPHQVTAPGPLFSRRPTVPRLSRGTVAPPRGSTCRGRSRPLAPVPPVLRRRSSSRDPRPHCLLHKAGDAASASASAACPGSASSSSLKATLRPVAPLGSPTVLNAAAGFPRGLPAQGTPPFRTLSPLSPLSPTPPSAGSRPRPFLAGAQGPGARPRMTEPAATNGAAPRGASRDVAVIGAGAAGLVAARELLREGHRVTVYEQDPDLGGVWRYTAQTEDDPLGASDGDGRRQVHSSMYASLRTNLPREVMGFTDFPFSFPLPPTLAPGRESEASSSHPGSSQRNSKDAAAGGSTEGEGDPRRFPGHAEVLRYLRHFARAYDLEKYIKYDTRVLAVRILGLGSAVEPAAAAPAPSQDAGSSADSSHSVGSSATEWPRFVVETLRVERGQGGSSVRGESGDRAKTEGSERVFDAVLVCNGHYSRPRVAHIPGLESWPGQQVHSHNYRNSDDFRDKVVVLIGAASSGDDLSKEISLVAKSVDMTSRGWTVGHVPKERTDLWPNLHYHPMVSRAHGDGTVEFGDGARVQADVVFFCTGYCFSFPFLHSLAHIVSVADNRVGPLFQHMLPPALAPALSFIGLPWKVVPFPLVELQSKWVAKLLSGAATASLPTFAEMMKSVEDWYSELESRGVPTDYTHCLSMPDVPGADQFLYDNWLAQQCGYPQLSSWREPMYLASSARKRREPWAYRDAWDDYELQALAYAEFQAMHAQGMQGTTQSL